MEKLNEFEAKERIITLGENIHTTEEMTNLINLVKDEYNYDYGVAPRSVGAVCSVIANYLCREMGLTGFQAGCVMWEFITDFIKTHNKCGMKLLDFDDMLYPQYAEKYEKIISQSTWEALQKQAKENLKTSEYVHPNVKAHWQSIVDGQVPFGYKIESE